MPNLTVLPVAEPYAVAPLAVSGTVTEWWTVIDHAGNALVAPTDWTLAQAEQARDGLNWGLSAPGEFVWQASWLAS